MEHRSFTKHAGLGGILAAGSAPAFAQAVTEVEWRLSSSLEAACYEANSTCRRSTMP
jgi:hypothetical protein